MNRLEAKQMYNNNFSRKKVNKNCQLQYCWVWSEAIEELVKKYVKGYTLNCPCGASQLGDVRGDFKPIDDDTILMEMEKLPYPDNTFDTVISDPPWKINFFKRMKPFFESVRVCKIGGTIIYNCTWRPTSKCVKLKETIVRTDAPWASVSVFWIFEKIADVPNAHADAKGSTGTVGTVSRVKVRQSDANISSQVLHETSNKDAQLKEGERR